MDDIFVGSVMSDTLYTVGPDTLVEEAAQVMLDNDIGSVLVVDADNRLEGILTSTDFVTIVAESHPKAETTVSRYMTTDVVTATVQDPIQAVAETMLAEGIHHMPVVDEADGLIGMITTTDLATYVSQLQPSNP